MNLEPGEFQTICACIGQIIVPFANFEALLNASIDVIYRKLEGNSLAKKLPLPLSKRIEYLTRCFNELPSLSTIKNDFQKILDDASAESKIRNCVAHSYVSDFQNVTGILTFVQLEAMTDNQIHTVQSCNYSIQELLTCGGKVLEISIAMTIMLQRVYDLVVPQG
jgi:hypothetical protein